MELFHMLNPINRTRTPGDVEKYKAEPYVIAADVYAHPLHLGRGGWTWYTGSAGWAYRMGLESLLGFTRRESVFSLDPCIPSVWPGFSMTWRFGETRYEIQVENPEGCCRGVVGAWLDGQAVDPGAIPVIQDSGLHKVRAVLGKESVADAPLSASEQVVPDENLA
jgi:cyclic beta-1,2-glucan synthetase